MEEYNPNHSLRRKLSTIIIGASIGMFAGGLAGYTIGAITGYDTGRNDERKLMLMMYKPTPNHTQPLLKSELPNKLNDGRLK